MNEIIAGLPSPGVLQQFKPSQLFLSPKGIVSGAIAKSLVGAGHACSMLGGRFAFTAIELTFLKETSVDHYGAAMTAFEPWRQIVPPGHKQHLNDLLQNISAPRSPFARLSLDLPVDTTQLMGIVNVTPDSFSDGGDFDTTQAAIAHALDLKDSGADILDIGGESTRPGADPVSPEEEQARVIPVVKELAARGLKVSIDTRRASTMLAALDAGAAVVNDVTALTGDADSLAVVAQRQVPVILMHMQGKPQTMQSDPSYMWAPGDVYQYLQARIEACIAAGLDRSQICVDPGIGFGKTDTHNLEVLNALSLFHGLGCPVMLGASRKSFIGRLSGEDDPKKRLAGSISAAVNGVGQGVQFVRVHDVAETRQALVIAQASGT